MKKYSVLVRLSVVFTSIVLILACLLYTSDDADEL